jgi:hypothetical protein
MIDNQLYLAAIHNLADVVIDNDEDYVEFSAANIDNVVELLNAATGFIVKWTPLSRPFFAVNKLRSGGVWV